MISSRASKSEPLLVQLVQRAERGAVVDGQRRAGDEVRALVE